MPIDHAHLDRKRALIAQIEGGPQMTFVDWWRTVNHVMRALGYPELLYGQARDFFNECHHEYYGKSVVVQMRTRDQWADDLAMAVIEQERS